MLECESRFSKRKKDWTLDQLDYLNTNSFNGQQEGIEWMKAGDLHEFLLLLIWNARLDSLQQGMGLQMEDKHIQAWTFSWTKDKNVHRGRFIYVRTQNRTTRLIYCID